MPEQIIQSTFSPCLLEKWSTNDVQLISWAKLASTVASEIGFRPRLFWKVGPAWPLPMALPNSVKRIQGFENRYLLVSTACFSTCNLLLYGIPSTADCSSPDCLRQHNLCELQIVDLTSLWRLTKFRTQFSPTVGGVVDPPRWVRRRLAICRVEAALGGIPRWSIDRIHCSRASSSVEESLRL